MFHVFLQRSNISVIDLEKYGVLKMYGEKVNFAHISDNFFEDVHSLHRLRKIIVVPYKKTLFC